MYLSVNKWRQECRLKEKETLLLYQRYVSKFGATGQVQVPGKPNKFDEGRTIDTNADTGNTFGSPRTPSPTNETKSWVSSPEASDPPPPQKTPPSVQVPSMAAAIESALDDYLKAGAVSVPSMELLGKTETFQSTFTKEEAEFRNFYRRQLERRGVDAKATEAGGRVTPEPIIRDGALARDAFLRTIGESPELNQAGDEEDEEVEGEDRLGPLIFQDDDLDSVMSGITFNSAVTREILDDCERTVVTFLKEEQDAIRRMMEDDEVLTAVESLPSEVGSASMEGAEKAENMVRQMQQILDDFTKNEGDDSKKKDESSVSKEARKYETSNPEENWMVYYDEYYQREYYHELNSNRTQWEPPDAESASVTSSSALLSHTDFMPEISSVTMEGQKTARGSRIAQYRRRRRRQRRRRILAVSVLTVMSLFGVTLYAHRRSDSPIAQTPVLQMAMPIVENVVDLDMIDAMIQRATTHLSATIERLTGESQRKLEQKIQTTKEAERKTQEEEQNRKALQAEEARRAKEDQERKARLAAEELARKLRLAKEAEAQKEATEKARLEEEYRLANALKGRVGGRIPLAYFVEDIPLLTKYG